MAKSRMRVPIFLFGLCTVMALVVACEYAAPQISKAKTEKEQLEEHKRQVEAITHRNQLLEEQNRLLAEQNRFLERIAAGIEESGK